MRYRWILSLFNSENVSKISFPTTEVIYIYNIIHKIYNLHPFHFIFHDNCLYHIHMYLCEYRWRMSNPSYQFINECDINAVRLFFLSPCKLNWTRNKSLYTKKFTFKNIMIYFHISISKEHWAVKLSHVNNELV